MASAQETATKAILGRFNTQWADVTPVSWPNVAFKPPAIDSRKLWAEIHVLWGSTFVSTMGGPGEGQNSIPGVIHVTIWGPKDRALGAVLEKTDVVRDMFNRVVFSGVKCRAPDGAVVIEDDPEWVQAVVRTGFEVVETI